MAVCLSMGACPPFISTRSRQPVPAPHLSTAPSPRKALKHLVTVIYSTPDAAVTGRELIR
jgi:hypothetical protein